MHRRFHGVLAAAGGLVLLESLFVPWYGVEVVTAGVAAGNSQSAWQTMSVMDVLLCLAALAAMAGGISMARPGASTRPVLIAGAAGLALSLLGLIDLPESELSATGGDSVEVERKIGPFLALVASGGILFAAVAPPLRSRRRQGGRGFRRAGDPPRRSV
ncbi:MAG: hypothetical protein ACRDLD_16095 [Thermoleophilaceae bacterium]